MTRISNIDRALDSSLAGPSAVSGAELPGASAGELPLEGTTLGASAGVAELDGMLVGVSAGGAAAGPLSTVGGAPTGVAAGVLTGVAAGGEADNGGGVDGD